MKTIIRSLRLLSNAEKLQYGLLTLFRALTGLLDVAAISLIGIVGTLAVGGKTSKPIEVNLFGNQINLIEFFGSVLNLMILVFVLYLLKVAISLSLIRIMTNFLSSIDSKLANQSATYFLKGPYSKLRIETLSSLNWTIGDSVYYACFAPLSSFATIVADGTILLLVSVLMFAVDPLACLFALAYFSLTGVLIQRLVGRAHQKAGTQLAEQTQVNMKAVEDAYVAFRDYFVYGLVDVALKRIEKPRTFRSRLLGKIQFLNAVPRAISEVSLMLGILSFVAWQFLSGNLEESVGVIAVFLASGLRIIGALVPIQGAFASLKSSATLSEVAFAAIEGFQERESNCSLSRLESRSIQTTESASRVVAKNIDFSFIDAREKTLNNISFDIPPGSLAALIGPSGSGKTTLVDIILGLFKVDSGKIAVDEFDPSNFYNERGAQIAYVPQKPSIIHDSILENIALSDGAGDHDLDFLNKVIESTQLEQVISNLPDGINTILDGSQARLSGGQIQRIGLARALYSKPKLLILDEATSSLDAETEHFITETVRKLTPDTTVLVIAHRLSTVKNADVVFLLEYGEIKDQGTLFELQQRNPLVERYINLMSFD